MNKQHSPLRVQNDVTNAIQLKLHERMNKKQIRRLEVVIVTSYGRNKILLTKNHRTFSLTNQNTTPRIENEWMGKTTYKK